MRVENHPYQVLTIYNSHNLDPVTVVLQDVEPRRGRIIVECFGQTWSTYWNAMGDRTIAQFICDCGTDYIVNKLHDHDTRLTNAKETYLSRIVDAVKDGLKSQQPVTCPQ